MDFHFGGNKYCRYGSADGTAASLSHLCTVLRAISGVQCHGIIWEQCPETPPWPAQ